MKSSLCYSSRERSKIFLVIFIDTLYLGVSNFFGHGLILTEKGKFYLRQGRRHVFDFFRRIGTGKPPKLKHMSLGSDKKDKYNFVCYFYEDNILSQQSYNSLSCDTQQSNIVGFIYHFCKQNLFCDPGGKCSRGLLKLTCCACCSCSVASKA